MRIAIVGTGGVGGYFGARLQAAGCQVCFVARGQHLSAMKKHGLKVISETGNLELGKVEVYDDVSSVPKVDLALSCVKLYDAADAAKICQQILKPDGIGISLQNGIDGPAFLQSELGPERTLAGSVIISAYIDSPGVIRHADTNQFIHIEERGERSRAFYDACCRAGFSSKLVADPQLLLWKKFVRLTPLSGIAALSRKPLGYICENEHLLYMLKQLVAETVSVGRAKGVELGDSIVDDILARVGNVPHFKPSMLLDLEKGRRLEAQWLSGRVVELGAKLGIATPYNDSVWASVLPYVDGV